MKKKLLLTLSGSVLSAMIFAGCTRDQVPPPEKNLDVKNTNYRQNNMNTDRNTNLDRYSNPNTTNTNTNRNTTTPNTNTNTNRNTTGNQGHFPTSEDQTGGGDLTKDRNTPKEEIIEDRKDRLDRDNIDR